MGTNKDGDGGSVMIADKVYDYAKEYVTANGGKIGQFFALAGKDRLSVLKAPLELRMKIEGLLLEARNLWESSIDK